ncbi:CRISPR-associated endonuclease Cas2 [Roseibacillus ishigakijimensis]|uniref:CRISPR-associated endoribonuclease Cas2 n=1 Tax=Roseibacillus ishigakijimensis TaxID=454146 RepID=A0A934VJM6_9BACT|nr:CRISPR-associated endonuclease Cas2 [Roseibacillus ishigakijimensis]MBK1832759.1 CRISPR-associated endonuclease Cas2 [Roseibacillus ishigakijimensis]
MLILIGYDITDAKRLNKVAKTCLDYGVRTQYSFFECHLDALEFDQLWYRLNEIIDSEEDKLVAYTLDAKSARKTRTAGQMVSPEKVICYLV